MPQNGSLTLNIARKGDFALPVCAILALALVAAVLSPRPFLMSGIVIFVCIAGWATYILKKSNVNFEYSALTIFPDGQIRLEFEHIDACGGLLAGQQWSTRYFAILRVKIPAGIRYLPVLSGQQQADDYRRLVMWLRQDFCRGAGEAGVPGV